MLHLNEVTLRVSGHVLLEGATAAVNDGERIGIVGRNGAGKSTLLKAIMGELAFDGGSMSFPRGLSMGLLRQHAPEGEDSLIDIVLAADRERASLLEEAIHCKDPHRIAEIHTRLADIDSHGAPARAARILAGLGFDEAAQQRAISEFSGGWRMRVALASLLFSRPDLLLLDEPSNHLDLEATLWLEGYLKSYPGTLLMVSHDRRLLNAVAQRILHFEGKRLVLYSGNYDTFERTRRERQSRQAAMQAKQIAQRRHIESFIERFRYKASKARQAQSRVKMLERMEPIASVVDERTVSFDFPTPEPLSSPIISLQGASVGYGKKPVISGLDLRIDMDDRIALLGANGNGKSTFMRLLSSRLKPMEGRLVKPPKLKVGYFAQEQAEELDLKATPLQLIERLSPMSTETKLRAQLGRFGFGQARADISVSKLSGGERARLLFALMTRDAPQLILLDEPTNHLDVDSREALIQALNAYDGALVLVTHDPHLIELVADRLWIVNEGKVQPFDGDLDDYRQLLLEQRRLERSKRGGANGNDMAAEEPARQRKTDRQDAALGRAAVADIKKRVRTSEQRMEKLGKALEILEARLSDPEIYKGSPAKLSDLQRQHADIKQALERSEIQWLEAQALLEQETAS
ncbi:ABC-F family ATP-binding cassette domain-containing protein [Limibacillus halophilus]|uniref:ATP-binding cassette subfamily F protein 3 n=1 Tax=Limibacillus halophilus TaxID=1579333 RepID=A0A839SUD7_9PROT|nr:ABC-F family ATP-binding cassette domain-containing protein [Limibacillus halophilus]MBB3065046.1 ATP-binding cassette subfamily F protein 3 [Limibacillus halophilus]